jgi:hypothetical protein
MSSDRTEEAVEGDLLQENPKEGADIFKRVIATVEHWAQSVREAKFMKKKRAFAAFLKEEASGS